MRRAADGVPRCERCAAPLKPDVVLFGEMRDVVEELERLLAALDAGAQRQ